MRALGNGNCWIINATIIDRTKKLSYKLEKKSIIFFIRFTNKIEIWFSIFFWTCRTCRTSSGVFLQSYNVVPRSFELVLQSSERFSFRSKLVPRRSDFAPWSSECALWCSTILQRARVGLWMLPLEIRRGLVELLIVSEEIRSCFAALLLCFSKHQTYSDMLHHANIGLVVVPTDFWSRRWFKLYSLIYFFTIYVLSKLLR